MPWQEFDGAAAGDADQEDGLLADLREAFAGDQPRLAPTQPGEDVSERSTAMPVEPGAVLGDFEVISELGRGGMGVVYSARQRSLNRAVALKVLPAYARYGSRAVQRFRTEAEAAARLHHSNVVSIYAQGEHEGCYYYAMDLIDGVGLDVVIRSHPDMFSTTWRGAAAISRASSSDARLAASSRPQTLGSSAIEATTTLGRVGSTTGGVRLPAPPPEYTSEDFRLIANRLADVADALHYAHERGVLHRDVKPHNLLLDQHQRLHLTDFGLARLTDEPQLTISGEIMGTPAYLSPEQINAKPDEIDHRTDIYSLGVTLYELLTRRKPFEGDTREQLLTAIRERTPRPLRSLNPATPRDLETICLRAMARDASDRHPTAAALADDLRRFADGRPILSRRATLLEQSVKWAKRHPAASGLIGTAAMVVLLSGALLWSQAAAAADRREARLARGAALVEDAWEQLVFDGYRNYERVYPLLNEAEQLEATTGTRYAMTNAMLAMAEQDEPAAERWATEALSQAPTNQEALRLYAWVLSRDYSEQRVSEELAAADAIGLPNSAEAWFFQAMAVNGIDPNAAIEAHQRAIALRAREDRFFPTAVLYLARARAQRMHATRSLSGFDEAVAGLEQLVAQQSYGALPHLFLSITHRLAGEIYRGSTGTRSGAIAAQHFDEALQWALRGQALEPQRSSLVSAEAHVHEAVGDFVLAEAARTRGIALDAGRATVEHYHYRWRLRYWLGDYEGALSDIEWMQTWISDHPDRHGDDCAPERSAYSHVFPALVHFAAGRQDEARRLARAVALLDEGSTQAVIWSATLLRWFDAAAEADTLLAGAPAPRDQWTQTLLEVVRGTLDVERARTAAAESERPWMLSAEVDFHAAALRFAAGNDAQALELLDRSFRSFDDQVRYTFHAQALRKKLTQRIGAGG